MDQQLNKSRITMKPSRMAALLLLFVALVLLSFTLIHHFTHKLKHNYTHKSLSLPKLQDDSLDSEEAEEDDGWKTITTQKGDTLGSIFRQLKLSQQVLLAVLRDNAHAKTISSIKPGQQIQFLIRDEQLEKIIFPLNATQVLMVYRKDNLYHTKINSRTMESHNQYVTATINGSLYMTAKRNNVPYKLIQQMVDIFTWEIDFAKEVKQGDQFSIIYKGFFIDDTLVNTGEIIAVTYTSHGKTHQAIRYEKANGDYDYYSADGSSLKKAFSRYPIKFTHISSTFSLARKHPILHYTRPHKGVDLAAPLGTPIRATGDGRIQMIGRQSDYGNVIKIAHSPIYSSLYGHLLKFQKGLSRGDYVKRGQIIGYVGQSGLATGPHCHYEFHINHQPKNPTAVSLPRAAPVSSKDIATFKTNANSLLASLKLFEESTLAAAQTHKTTG